jgi:hypothetical protein
MLTTKMPVTMGADDEAHANEISPFTVITVLFTFRFRHNSSPFKVVVSSSYQDLQRLPGHQYSTRLYVPNKIRRFLEEYSKQETKSQLNV